MSLLVKLNCCFDNKNFPLIFELIRQNQSCNETFPFQHTLALLWDNTRNKITYSIIEIVQIDNKSIISINQYQSKEIYLPVFDKLYQDSTFKFMLLRRYLAQRDENVIKYRYQRDIFDFDCNEKSLVAFVNKSKEYETFLF